MIKLLFANIWIFQLKLGISEFNDIFVLDLLLTSNNKFQKVTS